MPHGWRIDAHGELVDAEAGLPLALLLLTLHLQPFFTRDGPWQEAAVAFMATELRRLHTVPG